MIKLNGELSTRAVNCLSAWQKEEGSIDDIESFLMERLPTREDLLRLPNCGGKTAFEIQEWAIAKNIPIYPNEIRNALWIIRNAGYAITIRLKQT